MIYATPITISRVIRFLRLILIILILSAATNLHAQQEQQIEVIPYKIANPTDNFSIDTGNEYAKLISIAAAINKDVIISRPGEAAEALKKLLLNSQGIITEDDLIKIGKMGTAGYILIGTLSRAKGRRYISDSILYSMRDEKIISKSHASAGNLFKLAEEEMKEIFFNFPDKQRIFANRRVDAVILADLSYKASAEWESAKKGIKDFADAASENWRTNIEINIIPFSDKYPASNKFTGLKSFLSIQEKLNLIMPAGASSPGSFENALSYSVKNIPWRRNSEKILIIISNSENIESKFFERHALDAKMKKIAVYAISLGLLKGDAAEPLRQFSVISSGQHYAASYHQRLYNENGNPVDVFYQAGRIFHALVYDDAWKDGLFEKNDKKKFSLLQKPKSFLDEIFYDEKKYNINPYNLSRYYPAIAQAKIINTDHLEDNLASIMQEIGDSLASGAGRLEYKKPIAKAQVSDGKISLWIRIQEDADLDFLTRNEAMGSYFPLGVVIKKDPSEPYGIAVQPDSYITQFTDEYIPQLLRTGLTTIIKNPGYFTGNGLLTPPVWFINMKVERIERLRRDYDIRDMVR